MIVPAPGNQAPEAFPCLPHDHHHIFNQINLTVTSESDCFASVALASRNHISIVIVSLFASLFMLHAMCKNNRVAPPQLQPQFYSISSTLAPDHM